MNTFDPAAPGHAEFFYRSLVEATTNVISMVDLAGRIVFVNRACREVLGYEPEEMVGRPVEDFVAPSDRSVAAALFDATKGGRPQFQQGIRARRKDGSEIDLRVNAAPLWDQQGDLRGVASIATDVTAEVATQERLREMNDRYRTLVERLPGVSYVAEPGEQGRWRYVSPQIERVLGYSPEEWLADPDLWARCIHPEDRPRVIEEEGRDTEAGAPDATEYRMLAKDGHVVWVRDEALLRTDPDGTRLYDGMLMDVTDRKALESQLQFLAEHDSLTGLLNRRRFVEELEQEIKLVRRRGRHSSLVMFDLDGLKQVNDSLGHRAGDALIRAATDVLRGRLRETDTVGRLGGDEFAALLRDAPEEGAMKIAEELVAAIRDRGYRIAGTEGHATVSAGLVELSGQQEAAEDVLAAADERMYESKRSGGDRVVGVPDRPVR
jgi:diguanylate cyclase (GGDEF)-like protein/PAS domain S-box-containing protein